MTRREYYNLKKHQLISNQDDTTIAGLLYALEDAGLVYRTRVDDQLDETGNVVGRQLFQIWFTHLTLIRQSASAVVGSVCIVDATFNTNKAALPITIAVGVLSNGKTFPIAFFYCQAEDHESYAFFWGSLKDHWSVEAAPPTVVVSDQAGVILLSPQEQFLGIVH